MSEGIDEALYTQAKEFVLDQDRASAALLQRKLQIGYKLAIAILDLMEQRGIVKTNEEGVREVIREKKPCLCNDSLCAKCLLINCNDDKCENPSH